MNPEIITTIITGLAMLVGCVGVIAFILPGSMLIALAAIVWAVVLGSTASWVALAVMLVLLGIGMAASWVLTGKRLKDREIPNRSILLGGLGAIVGFFVIPVVGFPVGFVGGLYLAEHHRLGDGRRAWESSWAAITALGIGIIVEFCCALAAVAVFVVANIVHFTQIFA